MFQGQELSDSIQELRGMVAQVTGVETYSVYRLSSNTPLTGILDDIPVQKYFALSPRRVTKRDAYESQPFDLVVIHGICDIRTLVLGDILTQDQGDSTRFCFAQARALRENIFIAVDRLATIRSVTGSPPSIAKPTYGVDVGDNTDQDQGITPETETFLSYNAATGQFFFTKDTTNVPFVVPIGLQQSARATPPTDPSMPIAYAMGRFTIYIPPLPGISIDETTRVVVGYDRYELLQALTDPGSGIRGTVAVARRLNDG